MSKFNQFMKANKIKKENEFYSPTKSLMDEAGNPLQWEFKHLTSKDSEELREACTIDVQVKGKPNQFRPKLDTSKYISKMIAASVVMPDLYDAELQNSYDVKSPEELLFAMVDDPGEYNDLGTWVQQFQGFNKTLADKVEDVKN